MEKLIDVLVNVIKSFIQPLKKEIEQHKELNKNLELKQKTLEEDITSLKKFNFNTDLIEKNIQKSIESIFMHSLVDYERRFNETMLKSIENMPKPKDGKDGITEKDIDIIQEHNKITFKIGEIKKEVKINSLEYKGIYNSNEEYFENDIVTYNGSMHLCTKSCYNEKPTTTDSWKLVVKRGRDGKDYNDKTYKI